jgi:uncharacterized alpha-E superfamily protein
MSRYVERAENVARFIDVNLNLSLDMPAGVDEQWAPLVITTGDYELFRSRYDSPSRVNVIRFLTFDRDNPNSILSCIMAARENARSVREVISCDMWEHINHVYLLMREVDHEQTAQHNAHEFFDRIRGAGQYFVGVTDATMTHGEGWHFCRLARLLERADKTSRILDVKYFILLPDIHDVGTTYDGVQWAALLRSASAFEMYRQRHGQIAPAAIVDFLILDKQFPRAVLHCLTKGNESLHAVSGTPTGTYSNAAEQLLGGLRAELAYVSAAQIISRGLHEFVDDFQTKLNLAGDAILETFFAVQPAETVGV